MDTHLTVVIECHVIPARQHTHRDQSPVGECQRREETASMSVKNSLNATSAIYDCMVFMLASIAQ